MGGGYNEAQFEAWDMLTGRKDPELGGAPAYLDVLGVNYYSDNQWRQGGSTIPLGHHDYKPLSELLADAHARFGRPILVAETGAEGGARAPWLHYVAQEARAALAAGVPVEGICVYPILEYPGWENGRHCATGLLCVPDEEGRRPVYEPLAGELARQQAVLEQALAASSPARLGAAA